MAEKRFTQNELNQIVASRLKREHDRLEKELESRLKRCMAAVHFALYQEMCSLKKESDAETKDMLLSEFTEKAQMRQEDSFHGHSVQEITKSSERREHNDDGKHACNLSDRQILESGNKNLSGF